MKNKSALFPSFKISLPLLILILSQNPSFSQYGFLKITCSIPELTVVANDSLLGYTPLPILTLKAGSYLLFITNPKRKLWLHEDWIRQIQIHAEDTTSVEPLFNTPIHIRSIPFDAEVYLDEFYLGKTPLFFDLSKLDGELIKIKKDRYKTHTIPLRSIESLSSQVKLLPYIEQKQANIQRLSEYSNKQRQFQKMTYSLMALTICSGFATAYLKNQAELEYDRYLMAGNVQEMNRRFNNAKRFDKLSSISLGIFEASFASAFYFLIRTVNMKIKHMEETRIK